MSQEKMEDIFQPLAYWFLKAVTSLPDHMNEYRREVAKQEPLQLDDILKAVGETVKPYEHMIPPSYRVFFKLARSGALPYVMKIAEKLAGD
jgi:hypothetical protein